MADEFMQRISQRCGLPFIARLHKKTKRRPLGMWLHIGHKYPLRLLLLGGSGQWAESPTAGAGKGCVFGWVDWFHARGVGWRAGLVAKAGRTGRPLLY